MAKQTRSDSGSIIFMAAIVICCIVMPLLLLFGHFGVYLVDKQRTQGLVEAAGLLAANDMSRIVINDPNFGFVSLSNFPAVGSATSASDGEPLPVTGINTLVGTIRQNQIIAHHLGNATIDFLAETDRISLGSTTKDLNEALSAAISGDDEKNLCDMHGENVNLVQDVTNFLKTNLPGNMKLESLSISNGWLSSGGTTTIPLPGTDRLAQVYQEDQQSGEYKAFVNIPVNDRSFTFAGVGSNATLVNPSEYREADDEHICSIVRIECVIVPKNLPMMPFGLQADNRLRCIACCQPYSLPDRSTRGALTLRFSGGPPPGLQSWSDLLSKTTFNDNQITTYEIVGGDYPVDRNARMHQIQPDLQTTTAEQFAEHLYYWLRNGHVQPRIDAVLAMVNDTFRSGINYGYAYEFAKDGSICRFDLPNKPDAVRIISDKQISSTADTSTHSGLNPIIIFRDNVSRLGTEYGGKHAGQPLTGDPLTAFEMQNFTGLEQLASSLGVRKSCSQGIALDIEVGGIHESTASNDVESMRSRMGSRRI